MFYIAPSRSRALRQYIAPITNSCCPPPKKQALAPETRLVPRCAQKTLKKTWCYNRADIIGRLSNPRCCIHGQPALSGIGQAHEVPLAEAIEDLDFGTFIERLQGLAFRLGPGPQLRLRE